MQSAPQVSRRRCGRSNGSSLRKPAGEEESIPAQIDPQCLGEPAEIALSEAIIETAGAIAPAVAKGDYASALRTLAGLRPVVDGFFDEVMVMAPDPAVRANRLALLEQLNQLFLGIADISLLQTGETGDG